MPYVRAEGKGRALTTIALMFAVSFLVAVVASQWIGGRTRPVEYCARCCNEKGRVEPAPMANRGGESGWDPAVLCGACLRELAAEKRRALYR